MLRRVFIFLLAAGISTNGWLAAQTNKGVSLGNSPGLPGSGNIRALIIGISKYQNIQSLNYADADAYGFYRYLISPAGGNVDSNNIRMLLNDKATSANIFAALDWLLEQSSEGETVILYFSGHGDLETKTLMQNGFLLASDAPKSCYMAGGTVGIYYLQTYLQTLIEKNKAKVILISDACKSGKLAGGIAGVENTARALQQQWESVIKILSSQAGELSQEGPKWGNGAGVFSYYLLNGLKGLADMNRDKKITLLELFIYLSENVPRETSSTQNPSIVGNQSTVMAYVDSATLASLEKTVATGMNDQVVAMKGFGDNVLNLLDPAVKQTYEEFQFCISRGYLLSGNDTSGTAWDHYMKLRDDNRAESIINSMRRTLLAALQNKSQIAINTWVKGENIPDTISTYTAYLELYYAMQLIDSSYIMYNHIRARYLFWESVYTDDPDQKLEIMKECVRIEPNAPFAFHQIGSIYLNKAQYRNAVSNYSRASDLAPNWTYPLNDLGVTYDDMGMNDSAIYFYNKAIAIDPNYPLPYNNLANIYSTLGLYDTATRYVDKAIGLNPKRGLYYITKGIIFRNQDQYEQAVKLMDEGIRLEPEDDAHYYQLAMTYQYMGNYPKAVTNFKEALVREKTKSKYFKELARTYYYMGKYERAIETLKKPIELRPDDDENFALMGLAYNSMGQYFEALKHFRKAVELDSTYGYNWRNLSNTFRLLGMLDESVNAGLKSVIYDSASSWNHYYLSLAFSAKGDYNSAIQYAQNAIDISPSEPDFRVIMADAWQKQGNLEKAVEYYQEAIALSPDAPYYYSSLAFAYSEAKQYDKAEKFFMEAIKRDSLNTARFITLANFYRDEVKDYSKAEQWLNRAAKVDPLDFRISEGLGYMYMRMKDKKRAEESFLKAVEQAPNVAWNYYNLACLHSVNGNSKKALEWLEKSFQKGMQNIEHIKIDSDMDPIRNTPEFKALVKKYFDMDL